MTIMKISGIFPHFYDTETNMADIHNDTNELIRGVEIDDDSIIKGFELGNYQDRESEDSSIQSAQTDKNNDTNANSSNQ